MINEIELKALKNYLHRLALAWWELQPASRAEAVCDACSYKKIDRNDGYLIGSYLWCSDCFTWKAVGWIKQDGADKLLGYGVLSKALEMAGSQPQENDRADGSISIKIDETDFIINGQNVALNLKISMLDHILGAATRYSEGQFGTVYTYDQFGLTYHTDPASSAINSITLYLLPEKSDFMPKNLFTGLLSIKGIEFPISESMENIRLLYPEIKKGMFSYNMALGFRAFSISTDYATKRIKQFYISLTPYEEDEEE